MQAGVLGLAAVAMLVSVAWAQPVEEYVIGGQTIDVPAPTGMSDVSSYAPHIFEIGEQFVPAMNRLLAWYVSDADSARLMSGVSTGMDSYAALQVLRAAENSDVDSVFFESIRATMRQDLDTILESTEALVDSMIDAGSGNVSKKYGGEFSFNLDKPLSLGVHYDVPYALCFCTLNPYESNVNGEVERKTTVYSGGVVWVGNRVVYTAMYRDYKIKDDIDATQRQSVRWVQAIVDANRHEFKPETD